MSSDDLPAPHEADRLRRDVREFLRLFDGLLDSIIPEALDAVHVQAGGIELLTDPIAMRAVSEVIHQLNRLPGKPPSVPIVPLTHAAI